MDIKQSPNNMSLVNSKLSLMGLIHVGTMLLVRRMPLLKTPLHLRMYLARPILDLLKMVSPPRLVLVLQTLRDLKMVLVHKPVELLNMVPSTLHINSNQPGPSNLSTSRMFSVNSIIRIRSSKLAIDSRLYIITKMLARIILNGPIPRIRMPFMRMVTGNSMFRTNVKHRRRVGLLCPWSTEMVAESALLVVPQIRLAEFCPGKIRCVR